MGFDTREFAFSDTSVSVDGFNCKGLRGLTFKKTYEKEVVYGQGKYGKSIARKNRKYEGTLMLLGSDVDALEMAAMSAGYADILDATFAITCVYQKEEGGPLKTVVLAGVEITDFEEGLKQGEGFKEVSLPFLALREVKTIV